MNRYAVTYTRSNKFLYSRCISLNPIIQTMSSVCIFAHIGFEQDRPACVGIVCAVRCVRLGWMDRLNGVCITSDQGESAPSNDWLIDERILERDVNDG